MNKFFLLMTFTVLFACNTSQDRVKRPAPPEKPAPGYFSGSLEDYWYEGKAEINTYTLEQARYGEIRPGQVTAIFVSEDFLTDKQVKNDEYTNQNSTPVLKTNIIRRFVTGVYDYSIMSSVFTPTKTTEAPHTLKVTTSSQDWCGQTFTQLNYTGGGKWAKQLRSYFEREGDVNEEIKADFLEDELFNRIRFGWEKLPVGEFNIIPNTGYLLMSHQPYRSQKATARLNDYPGNEETETIMGYEINYGDSGRRLEIFFDPAPPYVISGWEETYPGRDNALVTKARLTHQKRAPYWKQNSVADEELRAEIGLK
ncbi:hypothetical protein FUA23_01250 [Neolewinella aurantiaca]|uniref:Septum formation inhibitor Maf n=1 Tax=Neolewinella aurantiaca TaxID=2602767 RepID=A0A5C7FMK0_9BACT|nr:hypothetical protein [Neolewinella aurantiaca]TXF91352.1 hypothetical protein FUA23_01250 [Neolewinella aurantiaca]